jgi:adenine-specific DNA-methyltransferase
MLHSAQKITGAYYTPDPIAASLVRWVIRKPDDRLLDPACGDGRFLVGHPFSVGIEQDRSATSVARARAPAARIHERDFFAWAAETEERFDCAAGNPPFIRYQTFKGAVRERARTLCAELGANFSGLASSWAPFLVVTASLLKPGGRMAFVVPAEIGHAPYAAPLLNYLVGHFERLHIVPIRNKMFPDLSEDCWLLFADGYGGQAEWIHLSILDRFEFSDDPPTPSLAVSLSEWRRWNCRLRPFLISFEARELYQDLACRPDTRRLGEIASVGIGYVSGANEFFHLRPSTAQKLGIPKSLVAFYPPGPSRRRSLTAGNRMTSQFSFCVCQKISNFPRASNIISTQMKGRRHEAATNAGREIRGGLFLMFRCPTCSSATWLAGTQPWCATLRDARALIRFTV